MRHAVQRLLRVASVFLTVPLHAAITGTVMNSDGKALAGARVSLFAPETLKARRVRLLSANPEREALVTATADTNGAFRIEAPKDKAIVDLRFEANGYAPEAIRLLRDDEAGAIVLPHAEPKTGTIKADGKPLAGATVLWLGGAEWNTKTDAQGRYTVPDPSKWANRLLVLHPDFARLEETVPFNSSRRELDRTLNAGVKASGRVVAEDGTGAGDLPLSIDGWPAGKTNADGTFAIAHAPKDWVEIRAAGGNRIASRAHAGDAALTLKLVKGATITGTARDLKTQLPLAGADIVLSQQNRAAIDSTQTDAKGNFTLGPLAADTYQLNTSRPNYSIQGVSAVAVTAGQTVSKPVYGTAQAIVSGTVMDEDKHPVAAALVAARPASREADFFVMGRMQAAGRAAYSGPDGRFVARVSQIDSDIQFDAARKGMPSAKSATMRLAAGERKSGLTFVMPRGVAFSGKVTDKNGKALSGVSVDAAESSGDMGGMFRRVAFGGAGARSDDQVTTASDGSFSVRLKEGKYDVIFKREGFAPKTLRAQAVAAGTKPVEVAMEPGAEIAGRVTRGGVGVEGVNINANTQEGFSSAITAADGSFTVSDLAPGNVMLFANKPDAMIQEMRQVTAPSRDVSIDLPAGGRITGRVVDKDTHRPLNSFQAGVTTSRGGGGMVIMTPPMLKSFTSDDGTFVLEHVKPGPAQVVANAAGYTTGRAPNVEVEDGKTVSDVEVALEAGVKLAGRVTDTSGSPLSGVSVRFNPTGGNGPRVMRFDVMDKNAVTDPNGEYSIDSLESGEKSFTFARSGYVTESRSVTLAGGKDSRLDVQMSSGMRVTGMVVTEGGAPVADAAVSANSASEVGGRSVRSDANGGFQIEALGPGHYTFSASKSGYAPARVTDVDISTTNNIRLTLKSGGVISGHVAGLSAQEMQQATVTASGSAGGGASSPIDAGGNFRIEGAPSGTVRVSARTGAMFGSNMRSAPPKTVELEPGGTAQVDLEFKSDTVVSGRLTKNNQPMANASVMFFPRQGKTQTMSSTTSDSSGHFEISGLEDGPYNVQVLDMERLNPFNTSYDVHGSGNFDIDVRTTELRGRVVDAGTGEAIADARVDIRPRVEGMMGSRMVATDSAGTFIIDNLGRGSYQITADKDGYGHEVRDITVGDSADTLEFKLARSAGVTLRVVDGRDGRLLSANVRVTDMQGHDVGDTGFRFGGSAAEAIQLSLAPGSYRVAIFAMGYALRTVTISSPSQQTVTMTPGGTLLIRSRSNTALRGRLVDGAGAAYFASAFNSAGTFRIVESPGTTTLNNVAPGHYRLEVLDASDLVIKAIDVDIVEGQPASYEV